MNSHALRTIITLGIMIFVFVIAISVLSWAVRVLVPLALVIIAAYIVYRVVTRKSL